MPVLVRRLADEAVFDGPTFSYLTLDRQDEGGELIDFRLRTRYPESP